MAEEENVVWKGQSNQLINFWPFLICLIVIMLLIWASLGFSNIYLALVIIAPLAYAFWVWLSTRCRVYELTNERMRVYTGVLNQEIDEVELYRVKDTKILRPIWLRIFGLSTVILDTSDRALPKLELKAVRHGAKIREDIRKYVEILRDKKRVREVDFEGGDDGEMELM